MINIPSAEALRVFHQAPFIKLLGLRLDAVADGECTTSLALAEQHLQHDGFVHAGVQATIADHTAGTAASTLLRPGQIVLTAEFKINLLRPARCDILVCRAKVLKAGATLTVAESEVYCGNDGKKLLTAKAMITLAVVTPRQ
jgi:uncharacterized protein (TIGR00369 family)